MVHTLRTARRAYHATKDGKNDNRDDDDDGEEEEGAKIKTMEKRWEREKN